MIEQGSDIFGNPYLICLELETCVGMEKKAPNMNKLKKFQKLKLRSLQETYDHISHRGRKGRKIIDSKMPIMLVAST